MDRSEDPDDSVDEWDVFISHANEDKDAVARPLTQALMAAGLRVWLDENVLRLGDPLGRKIDEGLARSSYGVVILSRAFFGKGWTARELEGLVARQVRGPKVILPVWHGVDADYVLQFSPPLANAVGVPTSEGIPAVAAAILRAINSGAGQFDIADLPSQRRPWASAIVSLTLVATGLLWSFISVMVQPPYLLRELSINVGVFATAFILWRISGVVANVGLGVAAIVSLFNAQRGCRMARTVCRVGLAVLLILILIGVAADSPLVDAVAAGTSSDSRMFLKANELAATLSTLKWLLLMYMYRGRR